MRDPPRGRPDPESPLDDFEALVLQLVARGYSLRQIAALADADAAEVLRTLRRAAETLGATSVHEAIDEARRRGLIV